MMKVRVMTLEQYIAEAKAAAENKKAGQDAAVPSDVLKAEEDAMLAELQELGHSLDLSKYDELVDTLKGQLFSLVLLTEDGAYGSKDAEGYFKGIVLTQLALARKCEKLEEELAKLRNKLNN